MNLNNKEEYKKIRIRSTICIFQIFLDSEQSLRFLE